MSNPSAIEAHLAITDDPEVYQRLAERMAAVIDALGQAANPVAADVLVRELGKQLDYNGNTVCEVLKERYKARLGTPGAVFEIHYQATQIAFDNLAAWALTEQADFRSSTLNVPADVELVARQRVKGAADNAKLFGELAAALLVGPPEQLLAASRVATEMLGNPHVGMAWSALSDFVHESQPPAVQMAYAVSANVEENRAEATMQACILESHRRSAVLRDQRNEERAQARLKLELDTLRNNAARGMN